MNNIQPTRAALLVSASGLVGQSLFSQLYADPRYANIHDLSRRVTAMQHSKWHEIVVDFFAFPNKLDTVVDDDAVVASAKVLLSGALQP